MLVGIGVAELVRAAMAEPLPRWRSWITAAALAVAPDLDILPGMLVGKGAAYHGTATHSVAAVVAVGLIAWWVLGKRWAALAGAAYLSHLVVDLLDDRGRTNVLLGWPFTPERPMAIAPVFPTVPFEHGGGATDAVLSLFEPRVMGALAMQTLVGLAGALLLVGLAFGLRRLRRLRCSG